MKVLNLQNIRAPTSGKPTKRRAKAQNIVQVLIGGVAILTRSNKTRERVKSFPLLVISTYELQHCLLTASVLTVGLTLIVSKLAGLITSSSPGDKADF